MSRPMTRMPGSVPSPTQFPGTLSTGAVSQVTLPGSLVVPLWMLGVSTATVTCHTCQKQDSILVPLADPGVPTWVTQHWTELGWTGLAPMPELLWMGICPTDSQSNG